MNPVRPKNCLKGRSNGVNPVRPDWYYTYVLRREKYLKSGMGKKYLKNRLKGGLTG